MLWGGMIIYVTITVSVDIFGLQSSRFTACAGIKTTAEVASTAGDHFKDVIVRHPIVSSPPCVSPTGM